MSCFRMSAKQDFPRDFVTTNDHASSTMIETSHVEIRNGKSRITTRLFKGRFEMVIGGFGQETILDVKSEEEANYLLGIIQHAVNKTFPQ